MWLITPKNLIGKYQPKGPTELQISCRIQCVRSLSTIAAVWAIKIYSWYLHSTPTHIIVACFHALNCQSAEIITPMSADRAPTRTNTTASTTRSSETRCSDASDDVPGGRWGAVIVFVRPLEVGIHIVRTISVTSKKAIGYLRVNLKHRDWVTVDDLSWHLYSGKVGHSAEACWPDYTAGHNDPKLKCGPASTAKACTKAGMPMDLLWSPRNILQDLATIHTFSFHQ